MRRMLLQTCARGRVAAVLLIVALLLTLQPAAVGAAPPVSGPVVHIVVWGENLTSISARYGVGIYEIAAANRISDPNRIYVGQRLVIPIPPTPTPVPPEGAVQHVVQAGDTLSALAVRYQSTVNAIVQANGLVNPAYICVGQVLAIPTSLGALQATGVYYTVRPGDTLAGIAYRYGVNYWAIVQGNNLRNPTLVHVGQILFIPGGVGPSDDAQIPVEGWVGVVVSNPPGAQYDDYFENPNGVRYGVDSTDADVRQQIIDQRDSGRYVYVWGTLLRNVPDVNGSQIDVTRIATSETQPVEGWVGTLNAFEPGSQYDDYFQRNDGERFGVESLDATVQSKIEELRSTGTVVSLWGELFTNVPDAYSKQVRVTQIKVEAKPGEPTPTPDLSSLTPAPTVTTAGTTCPVPTATSVPLGPVPLPTPFPPKPLHMDSPEYGMEVSLWGVGHEIMDRDLHLVKDAGFTWVKQLFRWRDIEIKKGQYSWAEADVIVAMAAKYELDVAIAVAYQPEWAGGGYPLNGPPDNMADFAEFMAALAQRYKGIVRAYEIWPGPNVIENWGGQSPDPQRYAEMLIDGYWYAKDQDPYVMIITGGLVQNAKHDWSSIPPFTFFEELYFETRAPYASDVFGVEALGFLAAPEFTPDELAHPDLNNRYPATHELNRIWGFRSVEVLHEYTQDARRAISKQWVITHMGWTTDPRERSFYQWAAVSEEAKSDYLRRAYQWAKNNWSDWIGVMFVPLTDARWGLDDDGYYQGIVNPDGCLRPAYEQLKNMTK